MTFPSELENKKKAVKIPVESKKITNKTMNRQCNLDEKRRLQRNYILEFKIENYSN